MSKTKDVQSMEILTQRYRELDHEKTRVQTLIDSAEAALNQLLAEAETLFGSRDVDFLEQKLRQLEQENIQMREKYQADLDALESSLNEIDRQFSGRNAATDD